jgi:hypothetical protein
MSLRAQDSRGAGVLRAKLQMEPCGFAADVNGDGRFDLFAANYGPNGLFLNRGGSRFENVSEAWTVAIDGRYDSCGFADFDNDGRNDLYVNSTVTGGVSYPDYLLRNSGSRFEQITPENIRALQSDHGVQWADFDSDGDADLALTGMRADGMHLILRNTLPAAQSRQSIHVLVVDERGRSTRAGSEIRGFAAGTRRLLSAALVDSGSGYNSQNAMAVHLGIGDAAAVDVEVVFPQRGSRNATITRGVQPASRREPLVIRTP